MRRALIVRVLTYWVTFGLGTLLGGWIVGGHAGSCSTRLVEVNSDQVVQAVEAALPAAVTGSGVVAFKLDVTGMHVHADSAFKEQNFDADIPGVVRGSPLTLEVSSRILARMISH